MTRVFEFLDSIGTMLVVASYDRYTFLRKGLDFLPRRETWWSLLAVVVGIYVIGSQDWLSAAVIAPVMVFIRWTVRWAPAGAKPAKFTLCIWEFLVWEHVMGTLLVLASVVSGPLDVGYLSQQVSYIIVWVILTYLYIDLFEPPRKRRTVKLVEKVKPPIPEFIT